MGQIDLLPPERHHSWMPIECMPDPGPANIWLRPILLTAVSDDGVDLVQVDIRSWIEKTAKAAPYQLKKLSTAWFMCDSTDGDADVFKDLLRTHSADTALFLHRAELRGTPWSCRIDKASIKSWLQNKAAHLAAFLDPLMVEG